MQRKDPLVQTPTAVWSNSARSLCEMTLECCLAIVCGIAALNLSCGDHREPQIQCGHVELPSANLDDMGLHDNMIISKYGNQTGEGECDVTLTSPPDPRGGYLQHSIPLMQEDDTVHVRVMFWKYSDGRFKYRWLLQSQGSWRVFHGIDYRGIADE